jgi:recombination protein RecA
MKEIRQKFGEGALMKLKDLKAVDVDSIPTGSFSLDMALGVGGVPRGRVIEIYGSASTGKTTLSLHIIAEAQKKEGVAAFIDVENALDPDYARRIGVNIDELLISQPNSGEQALQIVETLVRSGEVDVIVVDSVAALAPKSEIAGEVGDQQIGKQARLMSSALRKLSRVISETETTVIFLNQTRMKIGVTFGSPRTTSGGLALKFYSSVRISLSRRAQIKSKGEIIGNRVVAKVVKNKVGAPFRKAQFDIYYNEGISYYGDLLKVGVEMDVVDKAGSWYNYNDKKLGQGTSNSKDFLEENKKIAEKIEEDIRKKMKEKDEKK